MSTRQEIMNHAEYLVRTKGANGFSYADLATKLGIRKASIHYHFSSKNILLQSLIQNYHEQMMTMLNELTQSDNVLDQLNGFVDIYKQGLIDDTLCLCGMLTLDRQALPPAMQAMLTDFFQDIEQWLTKLFQDGQQQGQWSWMNQPELEAKAFLSLVQGAQIISRSASEGEGEFDKIVQNQLIRYL
ncbi:MAG: TetR/AcrR family transcriptional regulator [Chloroflexota bacterium]